GFEITRSADGAVTHVGPDVRAWRDRKLVNGWSYHYSIRALAAGGPSAPAVSPTAVPAARPTRPAAFATRTLGRRVLVRWRAANPRGRAIQAYRVRVGKQIK